MRLAIAAVLLFFFGLTSAVAGYSPETQDHKQTPQGEKTILGFTRGEFVMAALTLVYVGITGFYAYTSHKTLKAIEKQIEVADRAAEAAESAANRTRQLERPWLIVDWSRPQDVGHAASARNCGRTIARVTAVNQFLEVRDCIGDLPVQPRYGPRPEDFHDVILPPNDPPVPLRAFAVPFVVGNDRAAVEGGSKVLLFWGRIQYEDADGKVHETRFCCRYRPPEGPDDHFLGRFVIDGPPEYNKFT